MQFHDKLTIDGTRRTRDGYMTVNARVARGGNVQTYLGSEVGKPEMASVRVFRPADEVFSTDTMQSFAHRPVTLGHPSSSVSSTNWKDVAKGWSDGEVARDGDFIRVSMLLADAEAISAVEGGTRELSMGYDCSLDWTSGVSPSGEVYDAIQRGIRSNHVAIVPAARGGAELRIGDSAVAEQRQPTRDEARAEAARDHYAHDLANRWRGDSQASESGTPQLEYSRDGQRIADMAPNEQAYERMIAAMGSAYRKSGA
jgi:hypothetical protein